MSSSFIEKISKEARSYYEVAQSIDNMPPQNREVARQEIKWIFKGTVLNAYAEEKQKLKQIIDKEAWTTEMVRNIGQKKGTLWIQVERLEEALGK